MLDVGPGEFRDLLLLRLFNLVEDSRRYLSVTFDEAEEIELSANFEAFEDICNENNSKWEKEIRHRVETIFDCTCNALEEKYGEARLVRAHSPYADDELKCTLLFRLFAITIPDFGYDARVGVILDHLRLMIDISRETYVRDVERNMAEQIKKGYLSEQQDLNAQSTVHGKLKKRLLIGLGAVTGAVALGVTAGFAAPVVIPFFGSLLGLSAGAAFLSGTTATAIFVVVFGAGGAGLASYKVERRYQDISSFHFRPVTSQDQMRVAVGVSGWITEDADIYHPWMGLAVPGVDLFVLEVEKASFKTLGSALSTLLKTSAVGYAASEILRTTALATAMAALSWPVTVLKAGALIDNPWSVCVNIAEKSGLVLADAIRKRVHGHRPITLAGHSLGALVIFTCLKELAKDPDANMGVIENVALFGLPKVIFPLENWLRMRMLVAGRFIHCYSRNDWVLRFLYRSTALTSADIAGLNPISVTGIENVNMSNFVKGHLEYAEKTAEMLEMFNF